MKAKRAFSVISAVTLLAGCLTLPAAAAGLAGDLNGDGQVNVKDAVLMARIAAEDKTLAAGAADSADLNGDGTRDDADLTLLLRALAGKIQLPSPGRPSQSVCLTADVAAREIEAQPLSEAFQAAQMDFTAALLRETMADNDSRENLLISPYSVAIALGMTANGANTETRTVMEQVLGGGLSVDELNEGFHTLCTALPNSEKAALMPANSVWIKDDPDFIVPAEFLDKAANYFNAEAYMAAFDAGTVEDVNGWISDKTHEMIPQMLKELPEESAMLLINALAFEAEWANPWLPDSAFDHSFTAYDGTEQTGQFLGSRLYRCYDHEGTLGISLAYAGNKYSFAAFLPPEGTDIFDYTADLTGEKLSALLASRHSEEVLMRMPKFEFDYSASLAEPLKRMGMALAFDRENADFTGLNEVPDCNTWIQDVLHKTHITLDEGGTKAAAATVVIVGKDATCVPEQPREICFDRPFLFMILNEETGLPVFTGVILNVA